MTDPLLYVVGFFVGLGVLCAIGIALTTPRRTAPRDAQLVSPRRQRAELEPTHSPVVVRPEPAPPPVLQTAIDLTRHELETSLIVDRVRRAKAEAELAALQDRAPDLGGDVPPAFRRAFGGA